MAIDAELVARLCSDPLLADGYVAGGAVRDALLGRELEDLDVVVPRDAMGRGEAIARRFGAAFVPLHQEEGISRVVLDGLVLDLSQFRGDSGRIEDDLALRDFTINAMAVPMAAARAMVEGGDWEAALVDPWGGRKDCLDGVVRALSRKVLEADPLRLLRAFRFQVQLDFQIHPQTLQWVGELASAIDGVAPERIWHELEVMTLGPAPNRCWVDGLRGLHRAGLLSKVLPELTAAEGVEQPGFHHLDVFNHCLEAAAMAERLIKAPQAKLHPADPVAAWCSSRQNRLALKWAALLHDVAKPVCKGEKAGRTTFYHHDNTGAEMVAAVARRLRWSGWLRREVERLVALHMRPFHLLNDLARGGPSKRAMRRLLKEIGHDYPGLFCLAMADSMAGCGPLKPADLDHRLDLLWAKVHDFYLRSMRPVEKAPRLLTGHHVMEILGIGPGPRVGEILERLEEARVEGVIQTREEAEQWVRRHGPSLLDP